MSTTVIMPQLGESVVEGTVGRWLAAEGDTITEFEPLVEIESDKVTTEMPAPANGTLLRIYVAEGETVTAGTVLAVIGEPGEEIPDHPAPVRAHSSNSQPQPDPVPTPMAVTSQAAPSRTESQTTTGKGGGPRISPVVARIAAEHQIDLNRVAGTGRDGRVTKKDMLTYIDRLESGALTPEGDLPPWEQPGSGDLFKPTDDMYQKPATAQAPPDHTHRAPQVPGTPGEIIPLDTMRRRIAEHMVFSKLQTAPHVTTVFEADLSAIVAHRRAHKDDLAQRGVNLTFTAYFVAATAHALRAHPLVNSRWTDEGIQLFREVNIGMAVALDEGLIVPVIKQADELSLAGAARQVNDLALRARHNQLTPDDVQGGTFTITNHGVSGSLFATPIINQPQTGILGLGAIQKRVVVTAEDAIAIRPMIYITLTFDHRVLDGAGADFFVAEIKKTLENWI